MAELVYINTCSAQRQVACVGMNEQEARRLKLPHRVGVMGFDLTNRGIINRPQV